MDTRNKYKYANRESYFDIAEHTRDEIKNYGYDYHGKLFRKSVSGLYFEDEKKERIFEVFDNLISYVIDQVKMIKKFRNYALEKKHIKMR